MPVHVALIRALNVGGNGKLPMTALKQLAGDIGLKDVTTYIQSGNLVFRDDGDAAEVAEMLDAALALKLGQPPGVFVRSRTDLDAIVANNPFPGLDAARVLVSFFARPLPADALNGIKAPDGEEAVVVGREIYVHYPIGAGKTRMRLPVLARGTSRNINTVVALAGLAGKLEDGA